MGTNKQSFSAPRGMRDFYPEDMPLRNAVFAAWHTAAGQHGFQQYDACVVETLDLLKKKSGDEIIGQIYDFTDKSDRELALRPEMTPSLARMVAARQNALRFPLKWYSIVQCFRYERMSKGRKREHFQLNLDIIGENSVLAEVEVISAATRALESLGLGPDDFCVHVSSRALLTDLLLKLDIPADHHPATFLALDKLGKISKEATSELLLTSGLDRSHVESVLSLLAIKSLDEANNILGAPTPASMRLSDFFQFMESYGLSDRVAFDISIVRGLAYYTGIVFEAFDRSKELRAIFGGGRYDNLLGDIGGNPAGGVGLGFGDVVLAELLTNKNSSIGVPNTADTGVGYMSEEQKPAAISLSLSLRQENILVDLALHPEKAKTFFSRADRSGFQQAIFIGPDDVASGTVRVKNLKTGEQQQMDLA